MKKRRSSTRAVSILVTAHRLAVLAGGLFFAGEAAAVNLLANPGFEEDGGWSGSGFGTYNYSAVYYAGDPPPDVGSRYAWRMGVAQELFSESSCFQKVGLAGAAPAQIDAGLADFTFSAWVASYTMQTDYAVLGLRFLDASDTPVGDDVIFDDLPRAELSDHTWLKYETKAKIPALARSALVSIVGRTISNNANDNYVDEVFLEVGQVVCPSALRCATTIDPARVTLTWTPGTGLDSTGTQILRNGVVVATLPPTAATYEDSPTLAGQTGFVTYEYTVKMSGGTDSALCLPLTCPASFYAGPLTDAVVLHLPLDDTLDDSSGRANHGTVSGEPIFAPGRIGQAMQFDSAADPHQYVKLGAPEDFLFGTEQDFTVSVWVRSTAFPEDVAVFSNKDWNSGGNAGWVIGVGLNGRWEWNYSDGATRRDYDSAAAIVTDDAWHLLAVSHDRRGRARMFFDGEEVADRDISGMGDIDTASFGFGTNLATDGFEGGTWQFWYNGSLDDAIIWRRVVTPPEIKKLYALGQAGLTIGAGVTPPAPDFRITTVTFDAVPRRVTLTWLSQPNKNYRIVASTDLQAWNLTVAASVPSSGAATTFVDTATPEGKPVLYYRILELP